MRKRRSCYC